MDNLLAWIDSISIWSGKIFRWLGLILSLVVLYEIISRYLFNSPTIWAFDTTLMLYSMLFLFGGAFVLWEKKHIRVDVLFDRFSPSTQKTIDIIFYVIFFFPFVIVMIIYGFNTAYMSWEAREISNTSQWGEPVWQWRAMLPAGFALLFIQGIAEFIRIIKGKE